MMVVAIHLGGCESQGEPEGQGEDCTLVRFGSMLLIKSAISRF